MRNDDSGNGRDSYEGGSSRHGGGRDGGSGGGGRRGMNMNPNYFLPKPVKVGDEVEVKVEAVASKGDGIAKKDGFAVLRYPSLP